MNFERWRHTLRATLLEALKRPDLAIPSWEQAYAQGSQRAAGALGYLYAAAGRNEEAERWFRVALAGTPGNAALHFNLAFLLEKKGQREEGVAAFQEAVRLNPKLDRAWYGLGMTLAALGRHLEAAEALQEAASLQPMNPHAWYALGMARHHANQPDAVKEVVDHLFRFDPVMTRRLIQDAGRSDLAHLVADLRV